MTTEDKKLHAKFDWDDYRNDGDCSRTQEVKDLADAAIIGTKMGADFFNTLQVGTVTVGGKTFSADPEPLPGRHYLKQAKIYTSAEVLRQMEKDDAAASSAATGKDEFGPAMDKLLADFRKHGMGRIADELAATAGKEDPMLAQLRKEPSTTRYAKLRWKGFVKLQDGETAWDEKGRQLWPAPAAPAAPRVKPSTEFDL